MCAIIRKVLDTCLLCLFAIIIIVYSHEVKPRSAPLTIQHEGREGTVQSSPIERGLERAQSEVESAKRGVEQARIPRSPSQSLSQEADIQRALNELDRANNNLRDEDNRLYWQQRLKEDNQRELKIQKERKKYGYQHKGYASDRNPPKEHKKFSSDKNLPKSAKHRHKHKIINRNK